MRKIEEAKEKEANLEDIYFPSPPKITFEGYESATPDPNLVLENEEATDESYIDPDDIELPKDATLEPDVVFSDTDERDNEMVCVIFIADHEHIFCISLYKVFVYVLYTSVKFLTNLH